MRKLCASLVLLLPFILSGSAAVADVWVRYSDNEWREGRIIREDQWGTLVELKNALTNQYDPPGKGFRAYYQKDRISPTKPTDADHPGNAPGGMTAQAPNTAFQPGQVVQFNDSGKMADGMVLRQDAYGVLVRLRNWATGKFDGDAQSYRQVSELQAVENPAVPANPVGGAGPIPVKPVDPIGGAGPVAGAGPAMRDDPAWIPVEMIHNDPNWRENLPRIRAEREKALLNKANPAQAAIDPAANPAQQPLNPAANPEPAKWIELPNWIPVEFINNDPKWQEHMRDPAWRAWVKDHMDKNLLPAQAFVDKDQPANPGQAMNPVQAADPAQQANPRPHPLPVNPAGPNGVPPLQLPNNPIGVAGAVMTDKDVLDFLDARLGKEPFSPDIIRRNIRDGVMKELQSQILSRGVTPAANYSAIENNEFVKKLQFYGTPDFVNSSLTQGIGEPIKNKEWYYGTWNSTHVAARNQGTIERGNAGGLTINEDGTYKWINGNTTYEGNWRIATKPEMDVSYKGGVGIVLEGARGGRPFIVTEDDEHGNTVKQGIRIQDLEYRSDQTRAGR